MITNIVGVFSFIVGLIFMIPRILLRRSQDKKPLVQVVVLGDVGHSPRMQYHALSLAESERLRVEVIGYRGSRPIDKLVNHPDVLIRYLMRFRLPEKLHVPFVVYGFMKSVFDATLLLLTLLFTSGTPSDIIMIQTPPAVPTMVVCVLARFITGAKLIFDFHNITYMHLGSKLDASSKSPSRIVQLVRIYESFFAKFATHSLCVTQSMKSFLESTFGISNVTTLYDKPGPQFTGRVTDKKIRSELEERFIREGFTKQKLSSYDHVIVSSTSWTKDEDFSLVLDALPSWSKSLSKQKALLFITGKGEMKDDFVSKFKALNLSNIDLGTGWIAATDYPLILGYADAGISVHTSTSGLDLPMKAVDMLGSDCPVVAYKFPALTELLRDGEGGLTFTNPDELAQCLIAVTTGPDTEKLRKRFQLFASNWRKRNWKIEWDEKVWPIVENMIGKKTCRQARRRQQM
jgi:beta-1,4-mannosyltransferase